ncbi:MAG: hypothetical protein AB7G06_05620 [Bdellovibrionales bacterium]
MTNYLRAGAFADNYYRDLEGSLLDNNRLTRQHVHLAQAVEAAYANYLEKQAEQGPLSAWIVDISNKMPSDRFKAKNMLENAIRAYARVFDYTGFGTTDLIIQGRELLINEGRSQDEATKLLIALRPELERRIPERMLGVCG